MSTPLLRVTRYDSDGKVFHTCVTTEIQIITDESGKIYLDMPMRFWQMLVGGRIEVGIEK